MQRCEKLAIYPGRHNANIDGPTDKKGGLEKRAERVE